MAKDIRANWGALIDLFERIEYYFRQLEEHAEVPMTETTTDVMVKIMSELLGIFAIATRQIGRMSWSGLIPNTMLPIADRDSEFIPRKLIGRRDIDEGLSRLDGLTPEALMATAQVLKVVHNVKGGVEIVDGQVKGVSDQVKVVGDQVIGVDDKVKIVGDLAIEGISGQAYHLILFLCFLFSFFFLSSIIVRIGA